ncbi:hypothetical protein PsYK624_106970 [Phanerochaete sordida]|uniref:Protein kinase domain-containing protein n=1 Tax=Phanerochaete sordida TaxID=48140 RepID=A0A9P3LHV1_9APHY|nr:hypothetical protein PsYK624_106970 [Phanerochaete sordida]
MDTTDRDTTDRDTTNRDTTDSDTTDSDTFDMDTFDMYKGMPTALYSTLDIYHSYPEKSPFEINPPIFNLVPAARSFSSLDTPELHEAARQIMRRTAGINVLFQMNGRYPFTTVQRDEDMMEANPGPFTGYSTPAPLLNTALPDDAVFVQQLNPDGNVPIFVVRIGDELRLLKIYPSVDLEYHSQRHDEPEPEDEDPDPTALFAREREAYAHLLHYGVCDKGIVPRCYGWTTLSAAHIEFVARLAPELTYCGSGTLDDIKDQAKKGLWPNAIVLEYFPDAQVLHSRNVTYDIAEKTLRALYEIHAAYVLQGDIRGWNTLLLPDGRIVWIDFNFAMCASSPKLTRFQLFIEFETGWYSLYREMLPNKRIGI